MPLGDAVSKAPSLEDQMAEFKGFTTQDGEIDSTKARAAADEAKAKAKAEPADDEEDKTADEPEDDSDDAEGDETPEGDEESDGGEETDAEEGDESEDDADEEEEEEEEEKQPKQKAKRTAQKRINQAIRRQRDAELRADMAEQRLQDFEARMANLEKGGLTADKSTGKPDDEAKPKPDDYEYGELDSRYISAVARYEVRQEIKADQAKQAEAQQREASAREVREFTQKYNEFRDAGEDEFDDFDEVVVQAAKDKKYPISPILGQLIIGSDNGPKIAYHLASNPKEAEKVFRQSPLEQAAYFGRLEAKFESTADSAGKKSAKPSKAPPPVKNKARGGSGKAKANPDTNDFASFERMASKRG